MAANSNTGICLGIGEPEDVKPRSNEETRATLHEVRNISPALSQLNELFISPNCACTLVSSYQNRLISECNRTYMANNTNLTFFLRTFLRFAIIFTPISFPALNRYTDTFPYFCGLCTRWCGHSLRGRCVFWSLGRGLAGWEQEWWALSGWSQYK